MLDLLFRLDTWIVIFGAGLLVRQFMMTLSAERGRQQDLVKKPYEENLENHLSVIIPYTKEESYENLHRLLGAIESQDYPANKVTVMLGSTEELYVDVESLPMASNVKCLKMPNPQAGESEITSWLIDRCLAQGGSGILVFLKPDDIIKPNFFQNVAVRGFDNFIVQGYVALKNYPENPMDKVIALSKRLLNRVDNSGRFHMGMSCRIQDTGWAVKKEVLEMIPYKKGNDIDNLEYTIRLNLHGFRVTWAPNVVVYAQEPTNHIDWIADHVLSFFNRLRMLMSYGPRLLMKAVLKRQVNYLQTMMAIVRPPHFISGALLVALGVMAQTGALANTPLAQAQGWEFYFLAIGMLLIQTLGLTVARCGFADYLVMFLWTPVAYMGALAALPVSIFRVAIKAIIGFKDAKMRRDQTSKSYKKAQSTRFNEEMAPVENLLDDDTASNRVIKEILERNARHAERELKQAEYSREMGEAPPRPKKQGYVPPAYQTQQTPPAKRTQPSVADEARKQVTPKKPERAKTVPAPSPVETNAPSSSQQMEGGSSEQVQFIPLSNGTKQVNCVLKTKVTADAENQPLYQMILEYKSVSFSTQAYRIKDQAFYELQSKVMDRGLTLVSCGSCAYFYNPTADVPGALKNCGVCLFGKTGRDVNLDTDAVTVVSKACDYHTDMSQREGVVREWKESLTASRV